MTTLLITLRRYGTAAASVALVMLIKEATDSLFGGGPPLILFLSAVMVIARFEGTGPALAATVLSALVCMYFYFTPYGSLKVHSLNEGFRLAVFLSEGATICALTRSLHNARARAEQSTRHARAQGQALRESEQRFRLLVESVKDYAIVMLDPDGHVMNWNAGGEQIEGYRAEEIIGERASRFYPAEAVLEGKLERELEVATAEGRMEDEGWRVRKDGSRFWANVVITTIRDHTGRLRGFSKVTRDITERKRAQEALRESNEGLELRLAERTEELMRCQAALLGQTRIFQSIGLNDRGASDRRAILADAETMPSTGRPREGPAGVPASSPAGG